MQSDIQFHSGATRLAGSLLGSVEEPRPTALLISGSGPIDRNSDSKKMKLGIMRHLAEHLDRSGISTFRYDKRGVGESSGDYLSAGLYDNVDDAQAALDLLWTHPGVDPGAVFVVGHSEGAVIATELAARNPQLAGVVLLAGTAATGDELLRWQAAQVAPTLPPFVRFLLKVFRQDVLRSQAKRLAQLAATTEDTVRIQLVKVNAKWFREFLVHDPSGSLQQIAAPVLALTGSKDVQVKPDDTKRVCELVPGECTARVVEDMSHLLRPEPGVASVRTYKKQVRQPLEPQLLDVVASWIRAHVKASPEVSAVEDEHQ